MIWTIIGIVASCTLGYIIGATIGRDSTYHDGYVHGYYEGYYAEGDDDGSAK